MKKIIIGTDSNGGIQTVINSYEKFGLYDEAEYVRIISHKEVGTLRNVVVFLNALCILTVLLLKETCIVHVHASMRGSFYRKSFVCMLTKLTGNKIIYHLHGSEFKIFIGSMNKLTKRYAIWVFELADVFVVLSESWKEYVESLGNINVEVVNNCVVDYSSCCEKPSLLKMKFQICFLGALGERKGIYDLLLACKNIKDRFPNFILKVGGNGDVDKTKDLIKKYGLSENVQFLGWVNREQKIKLLQESAALVLPSYNEGLPMVILESLATKTLVVSTPVGGIPEVIKHDKNGLLVEPGNIKQISEALNYIFENPVSSKNLAQAGYETFKSQFDKDIVVPKLKNIYSGLCQQAF